MCVCVSEGETERVGWGRGGGWGGEREREKDEDSISEVRSILGLRNMVNSTTSTGEKAEHMGTDAGVLE